MHVEVKTEDMAIFQCVVDLLYIEVYIWVGQNIRNTSTIQQPHILQPAKSP